MTVDTATGVDTTVFNPLFKEIYLGPIRDQINNKTILLHRISRNEENISGKYAVIPLRSAGSEGLGAVGDGGLLPDPQSQTYKTARIPTQYIYGRILITGPTMAASRNDRGAFTMALDSEIQNMVTDLKRDVNRQLFSDGSGRLARVNTDPGTGDSAANPMKVDAPGGWMPTYANYDKFSDGTKYIRPNMVVAIVDPTGATIRQVIQVSAVVKSVGGSGGEGTIAGPSGTNWAAGIALGDFIARASNTSVTAILNTAVGKELMGIRGIVNDTDPGTDNGASGGWARSGGLQNIARASNTFWKSNVFANGATLRPLDLDLMQQAQNEADIQGDGVITLIVTTHNLVRKYMGLVIAQKRFVNTMELDGGWKALEWNDIPLVYDKDAPAAHMWFLDEETLSIYRMSDFFWLDKDGSILHRLDEKDSFQATLALYADLGTTSCNRHAVIEDLDEA